MKRRGCASVALLALTLAGGCTEPPPPPPRQMYRVAAPMNLRTGPAMDAAIRQPLDTTMLLPLGAPTPEGWAPVYSRRGSRAGFVLEASDHIRKLPLLDGVPPASAAEIELLLQLRQACGSSGRELLVIAERTVHLLHTELGRDVSRYRLLEWLRDGVLFLPPGQDCAALAEFAAADPDLHQQ